MSSAILDRPVESTRPFVDPVDGYRYLDADDLSFFPDELLGLPTTFELDEGRLAIKDNPGHKWTIDEMLELPTLLANGSIKYEIHRGSLLVMCLPNDEHSEVQALVVHALVSQGTHRKLGKAYAEVGVVIQGEYESLRGPDAAFIANASMPIRRNKSKYLLTPPDLCVEILSPRNTKANIEEKIELYLSGGVKVVWVLDLTTKSLTEFRNHQTSKLLRAEQSIEIPDVIPGFSIKVGQFFPD